MVLIVLAIQTTKSMKVLSNPMFCGDSGKRTIFQIALTQGQARDITRYSLIASEDEVLLPPGCRFRVESVLPQGDLTIIQLLELPSKEWIVNLNPKPNALGAPPAAVAPHPQGGDAAEVRSFRSCSSSSLLRSSSRCCSAFAAGA